MKICFVWVEEFRNFKNFGFNLSSSLKFNYDNLSNSISVQTVQELPNAFFGDGIIDVVGLIGKNGAGKSNAVELICKILKGGKTSLNTNFLVIVEHDGELICYYSLWGADVPTSNFGKIQFLQYSENINPLKVVFFSNVFDERDNGFDREVSDISVNNLFRKRVTYSGKKQISDFEKQIKLIDSKIFHMLDIELPTHFQIKSRIWARNMNTSMQLDLFGNASHAIREFRILFRKRLGEIKVENKFIHIIRFGFFEEKVTEYLRSLKYNRYSEFSKGITSDLANFINSLFNLRTEEITERLIEYLEENVPLFNIQPDLFSERNDNELFNDQISFLKELVFYDLYMEYGSEGARNRNFEYFTFRYSRKMSKFISQFMALFEDLNFFEVSWLGISSGHKAYLNLFASLYQELRYSKQENLLLCIDEGDLYLHPKWQVEFFDKLVSTIPTIFNGQIQLVLTSHSPFLLSDLPKQSITILGKEFENQSMDGTKLIKNTLGGNLYDLYSEPFFLGNKRTSDFAYKKIKELIFDIEGKSITLQKKEQLKAIIALIGDEVIQYRLNTLLKND